MTKPASELIALADELRTFLDRSIMNARADEFLRRVEKALRTAANQSGSERAGVDALVRGQYVVRKGGYFYRPNAQGYTSSIYEAGLWPESEARKYADGCEGVTVHAASEFTPPAQPAPESDYDYDYETNDPMGVVRNWPSEAPSTHGKPDGPVREQPDVETIAALMYEAANPTMKWSYLWPSYNHLHAAVRQRYIEAAARFEDALAALSPKIAAAETSPGDVVAILRKCRDYIASDIRMSRDEDEKARRDSLVEEATAAANRLDVKAEAKSQEPEAVKVSELYLNRTEVRRILIGQPDENLDITEGVLADIDELPIFTAADLIHPTTKPEAPAVSVSRRLEQVAKVMRSARNNKKQMDVWADDVKIVEDAIAALISIGEYGEVFRHGGRTEQIQ